MWKIWSVLRYEVITTFTRPSFLFTFFGIPLISGLVFFGVAVLNRNAPTAISTVFGPAQDHGLSAEGFVDQSGLVRSLPDPLADALVAYPDRQAAQVDLEAGKIQAYYIIPPDYLEQGEIIFVHEGFSPISAFGQSQMIESMLRINLLDGDESLASWSLDPIMSIDEVHGESFSPHAEEHLLSFFLPYAVTMVHYFIIIMSAGLLLNSVTKEKENRVVEILMSSITPRQLFAGKIVGLGLVGLLQTVLWAGTGYTLLRLSGRSFNLPATFQLPPSFLFWAVIFFVLGYAVYASLMAAVGALVPNLREASQATFVVIFPILIPLLLLGILIEQPHGALAMVLSLFPFTAPIAMMTRLSAAVVPVWQPLLSAMILVCTAVFVIRAVAGVFRAQTLLSGQPFDLKKLYQALREKT